VTDRDRRLVGKALMTFAVLSPKEKLGLRRRNPRPKWA